MEYRSYRDTDCRPSLLGLGCMRLPTLEPGGTAIDYARAGALVDEAVRGGITYFDVAYPYHGGGAWKNHRRGAGKISAGIVLPGNEDAAVEAGNAGGYGAGVQRAAGQLPCGLF